MSIDFTKPLQIILEPEAYELCSLRQQRDAALELAKELRQLKAHRYASENADLYRGFDNGCEYAGKRIEAIFASKERK